MKEPINQQHWNDVYKRIQYTIAPNEDPTIQLINKYVPNAYSGEECFEVGCTPCTYLANMGIMKKYIINGVDYSEGLNHNLIRWLSSLNLSLGKVEKGDFFQVCKSTMKKYEFVYSLGFVEHFRNYKKVICLHDLLVKKNGYLVITTPNYRGKFIYILHRFFNNENLKIHYIPSMKPLEWSEELKKLGYEIIFCGYFGGFCYKHFNSRLSPIKQIIWKIINPILILMQKMIRKERTCYSRYCGIVARKI